MTIIPFPYDSTRETIIRHSPMNPQEKPSSAIPGHEICSQLKAVFPRAITKTIKYDL